MLYTATFSLVQMLLNHSIELLLDETSSYKIYMYNTKKVQDRISQKATLMLFRH